MKKSLKALLSLALSLVLVLSFTAFSFAAHESSKTPVILIPGFGQSETRVYDENGEYLGDISSFELPGLDVKKIVSSLAPSLASSAITRTDAGLSKKAQSVMRDIFKPFALNDDGSPVYNKVVRRFDKPYSELSYEEKSIVYSHVSLDGLWSYDDVRYYYTYDSFGSIKAAADGLHEYLHNVVLAQTGASKVNIVPISQGGTILIQYLASYPEDYKYIKKIVNMIPAFDGSQIVGDVMLDNVRIYDIERLHREILPYLLDGDTAYQVSLALRFALSSKAQQEVLHAALDAAREMLVQKSTMMWALCPAESYEKAKDIWLSDKRFSAVRAEADAYDAARKALPATLRSLMESGVYVHIVASYDVGYFMAPLFGCYEDDADDLLSPSSPALGTTSAPFGKTLGENYVSPHTYCSNPAHNHISPDNKLDASTGQFPENTWYFKGVSHMSMNSREDVKDFTSELIMDDAITDIYSYPGYTQFTDPRDRVASSELSYNGKHILNYDENGNYLFYDKVEEPKDEKTSIWKLLYTATNFFFSFFSKLGV